MKFMRGMLAVGAVVLTLGLGGGAKGNAVVVTNLALLNASNGYAEIHFDLSWSNSWRSTWTDNGGATFVTNWDAVWVHAKQRVSGGDWTPLYFAMSNHFIAANYGVTVATNGGVTNVGVFIHRTIDGAGGVSLTNVILNWAYAAGGLYGTSQVDVALFAVEMVYIPEGAFYAGDSTPNAPFGQLYQYPITNQAFLVTNEDAIATGSVTGRMNWLNGYGGSPAGTISAAYPKGFRAFYSMKYEVSQGQYADFLNHVSPGRALLRYMGNFGTARQTIRNTNGTYTAQAPDRAANYMGWDDLCNFLDWSGLRPHTELEFEKMCRGFKAPIPGELAFGDISPIYAASLSGTDGSGTETVATASANICGNGAFSNGPIRCGIFARTNSTRISSGAGYFGNMELSGNVAEACVTIGDAAGRAFDGANGDGNPTVQAPSWPIEGNSAGVGLRGGGHNETTAPSTGMLPASARYYANSMSTRNSAYGGRGGRAAP